MNGIEYLIEVVIVFQTALSLYSSRNVTGNIILYVITTVIKIAKYTWLLLYLCILIYCAFKSLFIDEGREEAEENKLIK